MALFDIFDEISEKQATKTELGDQRIFGAIVGVVAENYSEEMPGRLCVNILTRDENANQLKWAKMAFPYIGEKYGSYFLPEKGDQVLLLCEDGNIEKPFVIGCIPKDKDKFLKASATAKNTIKQIKTRNGSRITFEDDDNEDGAKDKITVATAQDMHQIVLDNEKKKISVADSEKKCVVEMETEKGRISIHADETLEITVGDSITLTMNDKSGSVKLEAQKVQIEAGKKLELTTDGNAKMSGKQMELEATSTLKGSSSGMVILEGKPIKLG